MTATIEDFRFLLCSAGPDAINPWHFYAPGAGSSILAELDVSAGSVAWGKNRAGQVQLEVAKDSLRRANRNADSGPVAIDPIRHPNWGSGLPPLSTTLWVEYAGKPIWGGLVWELSSSSEGSTVQLVADEFTGYYDRLRLSAPIPAHQAQNYVITILQQLLQNETAYSIRMPLVQGHPQWTSPFVPVDAPYLPDPTPFYNSSLYVPLWYAWEDHKIGDLVRTLQSIGTGFDYRQGIRSTNGGGYEAVFVTNSPRCGKVRTANTTLAWGEGTAQTAKKVEWNYSARQQATRIKVAGKGERGQQLYASLQTKVNAAVANAEWFGLAHLWDVGAPIIDLVYGDPLLSSYNDCLGKATQLGWSFHRPVPSLRFEVEFGSNTIQQLVTRDAVFDQINAESPIGLGDTVWCHVTDPGIDIKTQLQVDSLGLRIDRRKNVTMLFDMAPLTTGGT